MPLLDTTQEHAVGIGKYNEALGATSGAAAREAHAESKVEICQLPATEAAHGPELKTPVHRASRRYESAINARRMASLLHLILPYF